jgi:hypothetical protein
MLSKIIRPLILAALIFGILFAFGLRIDHPKSGLKSALGSANSSLVVYWHGSNVKKGDKVVVTVGKKGQDPALAIVVNSAKGFADVQAGSVLARVPSKNVHGSLIAIIPFVGAIVNIIGL